MLPDEGVKEGEGGVDDGGEAGEGGGGEEDAALEEEGDEEAEEGVFVEGGEQVTIVDLEERVKSEKSGLKRG